MHLAMKQVRSFGGKAVAIWSYRPCARRAPSAVGEGKHVRPGVRLTTTHNTGHVG